MAWGWFGDQGKLFQGGLGVAENWGVLLVIFAREFGGVCFLDGRIFGL